MTYHIAVCDDEAEQAERLQSIVAAWAEKCGVTCRTDCFPSAEALLFAYADDAGFDILLLDVEMKEMSGIRLAKRLRADGCKAEIAFITSHFEFVTEGYEVDALHYLIKPVADEALFRVLSRAAQRLAVELCEVLTRAAERLAVEPPSVVISCEGASRKLYESEILYAESFLHDLVIHTKTQEYRVKENISAFAGRLSADFFRVHRSYLVNLKAVLRIGRSSVTLEGGAELPLARGKYDEIHRAFIERN